MLATGAKVSRMVDKVIILVLVSMWVLTTGAKVSRMADEVIILVLASMWMLATGAKVSRMADEDLVIFKSLQMWMYLVAMYYVPVNSLNTTHYKQISVWL